MNPDYKSTPSLDAARVTLMEERWQDKGTTCPCCDQHAQVYARKIRASQVKWLVMLVAESKKGYMEFGFRAPEVLARNTLDVRLKAEGWVTKGSLPLQEGGDYAKLELWGLIESMSPEEEKRLQTHGRSGIWRPTTKGIEFAYARLAVPESVYVYNGSSIGSSDKLVYIHQVLDKPFDYSELKASLP